MARHYFSSAIFIAGLIALVASQQYEVEPSRVWQPSRVQRTQSSSLFGNAQSSPQVPRRGARDRTNVLNSGRSANSEFENVRTDQTLSRDRGINRQVVAPPSLSPESLNESQERRPTSRGRSSGESSERPYVNPQTQNERRPAYRPEVVENINENSQERRPSSRGRSSGESIERNNENTHSQYERRPAYRPEVVTEKTRRPTSRPDPVENQQDRVEIPRSRTSSRNGKTGHQQLPEREREIKQTRTSSRLPNYRERAPIKEELTKNQFPKRTNFNPENEVIKTQRTRGRFSSPSTSAPEVSTETVSTERTTTTSTTSIPLETVQVSNEEIGTVPTERSSGKRFQRPNRFPAIEDTQKNKFLPRASSPIQKQRPNQSSRQTSKEQSGQRLISKEETDSPSQENTSLYSSTTESVTVIENSKNNQQVQSRGKIRGSAEQAGSTRSSSRGNKKANIAIDSKSSVDISEEDNYPKEFLEKILSSSEKSSISMPLVPRPTVNNRFGRARTLPLSAPKPAPKPLPSSTDSDVSESIHEDTFEQGLTKSVKLKETLTFGKNRYYGKSKSTTTTTILPPTTKTLLKASPTSSVDVLRQRYLDKLKQSQEERQQKLVNLRPKLLKETIKPEIVNSATTESTTYKITTTSFKSSRFSRPTKNRYEPKVPPTGTSLETSNPIKFRPRFSKTTRQPDSDIEPATPTLAEHARTRNRYSRLRKEELSVETPVAKTSWTKNTIKSEPKKEESVYNFIRFRTKDLMPLASEDVVESVVNNEVFDLPTTTSSTESSSSEATTRASSAEMTTTIRSEETVITETPIVTTQKALVFTVTPNTEITSAVETERTSESSEKITTIADQITTVSDEPISTPTASQQFTASTRHRFSSRYNGSAITTIMPENSSTEQTMEDETSSSTLSLITSSSQPLLSSSDAPLTSSKAIILESTKSSLPKTTKSIPSTTSKPKRKPKQVKTTTARPSFLDNRPVLRNIISLFAPPTTTTTKKPKTVSKPKPKTPSKPKPKKTKPKSTTTTTNIPPTTSVVVVNSTQSYSLSPLPLTVSVEEVINSTQDVINNRTSSGSEFSKVPREELDAFTPISLINTTEASISDNTTENLPPRIQLTTATNEEMDNITSQYIFFNSSSSPTDSSTSTTVTTPSTTTSDYFVYGIYPNNTVVKKRAWKTFDYEKYMSPYVIFGIYPNNTIIRKFPNGTIINDEFMTSDNEIGDQPSSSSSTTSTTTSTSTTTTEIPSSSSMDTTVSPTEATTILSNDVDDNTNDDGENDDDEKVDENTTSANDDTNTENASTEETTEVTTSSGITQSSVNDNEFLESPSTEKEFSDSVSPTTENESSDSVSPTTEKESSDSVSPTTENESSNSVSPTTEKESSDLVSPTISSLSINYPETTESSSVFTEDSSLDAAIFRFGEDTTTPVTTTNKNTEETTLDPSLNQVLPLTIEEVQSLWTGNFSDSSSSKSADSLFSSSFNINKSANLIQGSQDKDVISLKSLAFRSLSTSGTTMSTRPQESTTEEFTVTPEPTTRKPRVKFVTLTPGVVVTTDMDDSITLSSQHVQKVTKAPTQIPEDLLTNVFGSLEQRASSPIPEILNGNELEGDGLTAALARRIIALAMERAKSTTTTEPFSTTMMSTSTESATMSTTITTTEMGTTTKIPVKTSKRKQSTRTTTKGAPDPAQNALLSLPAGTDLEGVLQRLIEAQNNLEASSATQSVGFTTVKAPGELEKTVENQIRLAEEVRKASRTMKKNKKKKVRTTTQPPPFNLGFLFNFFNRPNPTPTQTSRTAKKIKSANLPEQPDSQLLLLTSVPSVVPSEDLEKAVASDAEEVNDELNGNQNDPNTRGQLLTAAIDVTRAVSKFMGTVINNAAQSFQTFMRGGGWGR